MDFNEFVASLPTKTIVIGQMADGTPITATVPTLFPQED